MNIRFTTIAILLMVMYILLSTNFANHPMTCNHTHLRAERVRDTELSGIQKLYNASIIEYNDGYLLCARYTNRSLKNFLMWAYSELEYESTFCFIVCDKEFRQQRMVFPSLGEYERIHLEDPRISKWGENLCVSVTECRGWENIFPAVYVFDKTLKFRQRLEYSRSDYFKHVRRSRIQKNWCPFEHGDQLLLHTDTFPKWNVFRLTPSDGQVRMRKHVSFDSGSFFRDRNQKIVRCSTSWKPFTTHTYIAGLHTKEFNGIVATIRTILVEIDMRRLLPIRKTKTLCFEADDHHHFQFLSGLETDDLNVYLSFGVGDYKISNFKIPKTFVDSLLK